jgi:hypothetical protein
LQGTCEIKKRSTCNAICDLRLSAEALKAFFNAHAKVYLLSTGIMSPQEYWYGSNGKIRLFH